MNPPRTPRSLLLLHTVLALALALVRTPIAAAIGEPVYGKIDNRQDLWEVTDLELLRLADSTVVLLPAHELEATPSGRFKPTGGRSLMGRANVCSTERFAEQLSISARACSGALVGPDLILTAGHCVPDAESCKNMRFVFGFSVVDELNENGEREPEFASRDVYSCRQLVSPAFGPKRNLPDFAVVRLERKVEGRAPFGVSRSKQEISLGTPLAIIGHPAGLPTKVAAGANVTSAIEANFFHADLDSYYGNSGSPVFNIQTGLIEGVLYDGEDDFEAGRFGSCRVSRRCTTGVNCLGEVVTRISFAAAYIP